MAQGDAAESRRKKKKKKFATETVAYRPASVIPGIPHVIEGMPAPKNINIALFKKPKGVSPKDYWSDELSALSHNIRQRTAAQQPIDLFKQRQTARQRVKPIGDPESPKTELRKRAARRRKRGRTGTILSVGLG